MAGSRPISSCILTCALLRPCITLVHTQCTHLNRASPKPCFPQVASSVKLLLHGFPSEPLLSFDAQYEEETRDMPGVSEAVVEQLLKHLHTFNAALLTLRCATAQKEVGIELYQVRQI